MGVPEADWKNQPWHVLDWLTVAVAVVLSAMFAYGWWTDGHAYQLGLSLVLLVWLAIFFSSYWQPILYPVIVVVFTVYALFALLVGHWDRPMDQIRLVLSGGFVLLALYLFVAEDPGL